MAGMPQSPMCLLSYSVTNHADLAAAEQVLNLGATTDDDASLWDLNDGDDRYHRK